ncbi:hypothetical protein ONZ45_g8496 [Pleurotus djamor]|nr:hypothetical protein ONZ45_g8496 [Pleurotus djamor]
MQRIPNELIYQVIEALSRDDGPPALYPLLFVSKSTYAFSVPFFYKSVIIQGDSTFVSSTLSTSNRRHAVHLSSEDNPTIPRSSSSSPSQCLPRLHHTLAHAPTLAAHVQAFIVGPFSQRDDWEEFLQWGSVGGILQLLVNLKRLALDPSPDRINLTSLFDWISPKAKLTHLSCSISNDSFRDILKLITSHAQSIQFIRVTGHNKNGITSSKRQPLGELPKLRSVEGLPGIWQFFARDATKLEHLAAIDLPMFAVSPATTPNPTLTYRNIRTIHLSSSVPATFGLTLPHLVRVELLYIGFPVYGSKIPLSLLLEIPSNQLKYIRIACAEKHGSHCRPLFAQFPSLQVIDIVRLATHRFTRSDQDYGYMMHSSQQTRNYAQMRERSGVLQTWWEILGEELDDVSIDFTP